MEIDKILYKEIKEYCDLNGLKTRDYIHSLLKKAFNEDRYGDRPFMPIKVELNKKEEENFDKVIETVGETEKQKSFEEQYPDLAERHRKYSEYPKKEKDPYTFEQEKKEQSRRKIQPK